MLTKTGAIFPNKNLYDQDFYLWLTTIIEQIKEENWSEIDKLNLIEELATMGRSEKRELKNRLIVLLTHLLKWNYQINKRSPSWINTIKEQRRQLNFLLEDSPSLKSFYLEIFPQCYNFARQDAAQEIGLSINNFPLQPCFSEDFALNSEELSDS
jgi:hypothetical protein